MSLKIVKLCQSISCIWHYIYIYIDDYMPYSIEENGLLTQNLTEVTEAWNVGQDGQIVVHLVCTLPNVLTGEVAWLYAI